MSGYISMEKTEYKVTRYDFDKKSDFYIECIEDKDTPFGSVGYMIYLCNSKYGLKEHLLTTMQRVNCSDTLDTYIEKLMKDKRYIENYMNLIELLEQRLD